MPYRDDGGMQDQAGKDEQKVEQISPAIAAILVAFFESEGTSRTYILLSSRQASIPLT